MKLLKRILKIEAGQALPMALILLVLGGLLVVPMLSFMTTSLNANRTVNTKTLAIYAADSGIQDALWKLGDGVDLFASGDWYDLAENVNGMTVTVDKYQPTQQMVDGDLYTIRSTAYLNGEPKAVIIAQAVAGSDDYSFFFDAAITAAQDVTITNADVIGDVVYGGGLDLTKTTIDGETIYDPDLQDNWPSAEYLSSFYLAKVADLINTPFASSQITISGVITSPTPIPRLYRDGSLLLKGGGWARLGVDTKAGTADATEANFLIDADGDFDASYVGSTVWNTTDDTYALVSSYVSSGRLGISEDIMANDETYTMYNKNLPVYVTGALSVNPTGDCVLDLNGNTFFVAYDNNCSGDAIYLGPKTTLRGSGCFIAVGNITFQPNLGSAGDKLVGVDYTTSFSETAPANTLLLSKFTAEHNGAVKTFSVLCKPSASGYVRLAMYGADPDTGEPTTLMRTPDNLPSTTPSMPVDSGLNNSGLNDIDFPETEVEAGKSYWLAAISNTAVIGYKTFTTPQTWDSRTKPLVSPQTYSNFTFTETLTGLTTVTNKQYLLAGNALPFVFVMSIECKSLLQPNGDLYGSIAGSAEVELKPGCTLELTAVPDTGLDFPSITGPSSGPGEGGNSPPLLNYNIQ